jgi:hypothetical protein
MINTKRMLLAFVVALAVVVVYNFLVFGLALNSFNEQHPDVLRAQADLPKLRMFLSGALEMALVCLFYALFARNRASSLSTGLVFGVLLGLIAGWIPQASMKMLLVHYPLYVAWAPAIFGQYVVTGTVLGLVYRE